MGLDVSDCDSGILEIRLRGKGARRGVPYAEGGLDRDLNGLLRLRGDVAGPLMLPYGGRRDACAGSETAALLHWLQSPIPGAWEPASATAP